MIDGTSDSSTGLARYVDRAFTGHCARLGRALKPGIFAERTVHATFLQLPMLAKTSSP
jgi:hypothetical protein